MPSTMLKHYSRSRRCGWRLYPLQSMQDVLLSCFKTHRDQQVRDWCITCSVSPAGSFSLSVEPAQTLVVSELTPDIYHCEGHRCHPGFRDKILLAHRWLQKKKKGNTLNTLKLSCFREEVWSRWWARLNRTFCVHLLATMLVSLFYISRPPPSYPLDVILWYHFGFSSLVL